MEELRDWLPMWAHDSLDLMLVVLQIAGIVFVAWFARRILRKLLNRMVDNQHLPVDIFLAISTKEAVSPDLLISTSVPRETRVS